MTDLLHVIPDFPFKPYTHLIPSLEKHFITTTDLISLDPTDVARRAHLPVLDVRRLATHVVQLLHKQLGLTGSIDASIDGNIDGKVEDGQEPAQPQKEVGRLRKTGAQLVEQWQTISTLDEEFDVALGGGIPTSYLTEITGESGAGKTQLLLTLLLSTQLPPPHGLKRPTLYISTEHSLPTNRLTQIIHTHPLLAHSSASLSQILTLQTPDLESQDHILTYQLPVALARHNIGLVVIDSITANYRSETASAAALTQRSTLLTRVAAHLRQLARMHNCAFVVSNQVADRFAPLQSSHRPTNHPFPSSGPYPAPSSSSALVSKPFSNPDHAAQDHVLGADAQLRFYTGWGDSAQQTDLKNPALGLVWANQIACRIALVKEGAWATGKTPGHQSEIEGSEGYSEQESEEWVARKWRRWMKVVFSSWVQGVGEGERGVEFELWAGGVRAVRQSGQDEPRRQE